MNSKSTQIDAAEAMSQLRYALDELGAAEAVDTAVAFVLVQKLGEAMRQSYSKRKEDSVRELITTSQKYKSNEKTIALGALIDAFLMGWIGADKMG